MMLRHPRSEQQLMAFSIGKVRAINEGEESNEDAALAHTLHGFQANE